MKKERKQINWEKFFFEFTLASLLISIVIVGILMYLAPSEIDPSQPYVRIKSDYTLMFAQCILGVIVIFLPSMFEKKVKIDIPSHMMIMYCIFLYCAIFLGEVRAFYYNVPNWDTLLHTFSGGMLGALGFSFITFLNNQDKVPMNLSPLFVALFAFCFAVTLGVVWEVYEFTFDGILGLNMQKFMTEQGTQFIGRAALQDTMKDLIVDCVGAAIVSVAGYIKMKVSPTWLQKIQFQRISSKKEEKSI